MAAQANSVSLSTNLNVAPYYDDFDEAKNFHRILFRPGLAVQARELTQMQTILQNQIDRFGEHIFKEGSIVAGCSVGVDTNYNYVKLYDTITPITTFANTIVKGTTSQISALVVNVADGSQSNTPNFQTLFVSYLNANTTTGYSRFANNETLTIVKPVSLAGTTVRTITAGDGGATGIGSAATVSQGIIFAKDHFIRVPQQTIILDRYSTTPTYRIGFNVVESIVTEITDTSLLDPASGSYNYAAPGAARLKLLPTFVKQNPTGSLNTKNFVELNQIKNGVLQKTGGRSDYAAIRDYLARRTFDESGHYIVYGFNTKVRSHLKVANNDGVYTSAQGGNTNLLVVEASPGVAYVGGFDIEKLVSTQVNLDKATDYEQLDSAKALVDYGNYVIVNDVAGNWDLNQQSVVSLRSQQCNAVSRKTYSTVNFLGSELGTARVRGFEYYAGTPGTPDAQYKMYLTDITMKAGYSFANVMSVGYNGGAAAKLGKADIILSNGKNANTQESSFNRAIFKLPARAIRRLRDSSGVVNNDYSFYKEFPVTFQSNGVATFSTADSSETLDGSGVLSASATRTDYHISLTGTSNTNFLIGQVSIATGANTVTQGSNLPQFQNQVGVGDIINIGTAGDFVVSEVNATTLKVYGTSGATVTNGRYFKKFKAGQVIAIGGKGSIGNTTTSGTRTITVSGTPSTTALIDLRESLNASVDATVVATLNKIDGQEASKSINRDRLVQIHINSNRGGSGYTANTTGPWNLGVADGFRLVSVRKKNGTDFSANNQGVDVTSNFYLDTGMTDDYYDHAKLVKKSTSGLTISNNDRLLVKFDFFTHSTSSGKGFLSIDSYPINDTTAGTDRTKIFTYEIPRYSSATSGDTFDLRDCVDFRPRKTDTANSVTSVTNIATNPKTSNSFVTVLGGLHFSPPGQDFTTDLSDYLMRIDSVGVTKNGDLTVLRGAPANNPRGPNVPSEFMPLASIRLTPYPSLPEQVARAANRMDLAISVVPYRNERYTMRAIGGISDRISRLEYYTSLNMIEKDTKSLLVQDENGLDRFKNGFLVDNFTGSDVVDVYNLDKKCSIDPDKQELRPQIKLDNIEMFFQAANSSHLDRQSVSVSGVSREQRIGIANSKVTFANGEIITIGSGTARVQYKINDRIYVTNATANFTVGSTVTGSGGSTTVYDTLRAYDTVPEGNRVSSIVSLPYSHRVVVRQPYATTSRNISGIAFNWIGMMKIDPSIDYWVDTTKGPEVNNTVDTGYDNWKSESATWPTEYGAWGTYVYGKPKTGESSTTNGSQYESEGHYYRDDTTTTQYSQDYTGSRSGTQRVVKENTETKNLGTFVTSTNLIPYMRSKNIEVEARGMKPGARLYTFFDKVDVSAYVTPTDIGFAPTGAEGSPLYVDSAGRVHALFRIPADDNLRFTVGNKILRLTDSPTNESDLGLVTTSAETQYSAGGQAQTTSESNLTVRSAVIAQEERSQKDVYLGTKTWEEKSTVTVDLGEVPSSGGGDDCGSSIICTKLYQLGLLDETTYYADEKFGQQLRATNPDVYYGYINWAKHVVEWMSGQNPDVMFWIRDPEIRRQVETEVAIRMSEAVARPWAEHMAFLMGARESDNKYGKFIMNFGTKVSKLFANTNFGRKKPSLLARYTMIAVFMMLFAGSKIANKVSAKETEKVWGSV
jgi:hypothetical protein